MKIKRFLSLSIIGLAFIACSLGAIVALDTWMAMDGLTLASARLTALRAMSDIPATILPQRSLLALMVSTGAPGDAAQPATLARIRQTSDTAFAQAAARARAMTGSGEEANALDTGITNAASRWTAIEQSVDAALTKPIGERGDLAARVLQESIAINSTITALMRDELRRLADTSGNSFRYADIANTVWQLRETAGTPAGLLINILASHKPVSPELRASLLKYEAQVQTIWDNLAPLATAQDTPARLQQALADVKAAYFGTLVPAEQKIAAEFDTGNYPFEAMDFRNNRTQKVWPTMTALRDVAYQLAEDAISTDRAKASSRFYIAIVGSVIAVVISLVISLLVGRRVTRPLVAITRSMTRVSEGELDLSIPGAGRSDEIGDMATALQVFKDSLRRNRDLELASTQEREAATLRRNAAMADLAASFETSVGGIVRAVSTSSRELEDAARAMTRTAVDTSNRSTNVAAAAEEASTNVGAVASSAEQLGASVHEISRQVQQSSQMSEAAVREANETAGIVRELATTASKISDVLSLISTIAGQTNLLALNATIEAARAGEAGRGFAIVASEVKELATQTAKATSEISAQISAIQSSTDRAVGAIGGIATTIQSMNAVATAISEAVAQQGLATSEIVRTISQASAGTSDVTSNIGAVAEAAQQSGIVAQQVLSSSGTLSGQAEDLRRQVDRFLETVRAA